VRITRYPSISEDQFFGCVSAFVDSLEGELNAAAGSLRRLENKGKGDAFAYEMTLDTHRYGALIVLDRWATVAGTFGPHLELTHDREIVESASERVKAAEFILNKANGLVDASESYSTAVVEACIAAFHALRVTFLQERTAAERASKLGPMLPGEYTSARRIFLEDLAAR
jgi:hypothetical protein